MTKTIVVDFPDGFDFPEKADIFDHSGKCSKCPLMANDDWAGYCFVTDESDTPCPFFEGAEEATLIR